MSKVKKNSLVSELESLQVALEAGSDKTIIKGSALDTHDLSIPYSYMFSPAAKRGMLNKVKELCPKRKLQFISTLETEVIDKVEYFTAIAVSPEKIVKAARIITDLINSYAAKGHITGCLSPLSYIKLVNEPHQLENYAVYCFVSMTEEGSKLAAQDKSGYITQEGKMGPEVT